MPDQFKEVTTTGLGGRFMKSIQGVILGVILFALSFVVLFWNEGRVDTSKIAQNAVEVNATATSTDQSLQGKLVALSANLNSPDLVGDKAEAANFSAELKADKYSAVKRKVEMYAWVEHTTSKTTKKTGGSESTETTYDYKKEWVEDVPNTDDFKYKEDHQNPSAPVKSTENRVPSLFVGVYGVDSASIELPPSTPLTLNTDKVVLSGAAKLMGQQYVFVASSATSTIDMPNIGDLRISYEVVPVGTHVTAIGQLNGMNLEAYHDAKNNTLYRIFNGSKADAVATLHQEYTTSLWILRLVGFLMMWFGLMLFFEPLSTVLDILPIFGSLSRGLIGVASFVVALTLSIVTIIISLIVHNIIALILAVAVIIGVIIFGLKFWRKTKAPAAPAQT